MMTRFLWLLAAVLATGGYLSITVAAMAVGFEQDGWHTVLSIAGVSALVAACTIAVGVAMYLGGHAQ